VTKTIAIAEKGGKGKTAAALLIELFSQKSLVLAVHDGITPLMSFYMPP
jgi:CO dehydrogenase nickel-insertion accessory protein CooC1